MQFNRTPPTAIALSAIVLLAFFTPSAASAAVVDLPSLPGYPKLVPYSPGGNEIQPKVYVDEKGEAWVVLLNDESPHAVYLYQDLADTRTLVADPNLEPTQPDVHGNRVSFTSYFTGAHIRYYDIDSQTYTQVSDWFPLDHLAAIGSADEVDYQENWLAWQRSYDCGSGPNEPGNEMVWFAYPGCNDPVCTMGMFKWLYPNDDEDTQRCTTEQRWPTIDQRRGMGSSHHYGYLAFQSRLYDPNAPQEPYVIQLWDVREGPDADLMWEYKDPNGRSAEYPHLHEGHLVFHVRGGTVAGEVLYYHPESDQLQEVPTPNCWVAERPRISHQAGQYVLYNGRDCTAEDDALFLTDRRFDECIFRVVDTDQSSFPWLQPTYWDIYDDVIVYSIQDSNGRWEVYIDRIDVDKANEYCRQQQSEQE